MAANLNNPNHTNTFENGLYRDSHPLNQPQGTYRDLRNSHLISHDGNNYTVEDALGNKLIFDIPRRYNATTGARDQFPMPIGFISFVDMLIVFSTNDESTNGGYGEIGVLYPTNFGQSVSAESKTITVAPNTWTFSGYVPLYNHESLYFSKMYKIEGFGFAENPSVKRIYWTDNFNQPRTLEVTNSIFSDYRTPGAGNPIVSGEQYMVVTGAITHNAVVYGPGLTAGNIFTAVSGVYTVTAGQPLVIPYYDVNLLDFAPSTILGNIKFNSFGSGSKNCGNKMYFHRLYDSSGGIYTSWSFGCFPVHVGLDQNPLPHLNSQHYYVGAGSSSTLVNSGKSVKVDIDNIDTKYDTIELACAEFDQSNEVITQITIVCRESITSSEMLLEDFGNVNLGTLTLDDITLFPANVLKCKTLTTNKNYILVGNISEREEFDTIDFSDVQISEIAYEMPVDGSKSDTTNYLTFGGNPTPINPSIGVNPASIRPYERWVVTSIAGGNVTYNAVSYTLDDVFIGVTGVTAVTIPVGSQIRPCVSLNRYDPVNTGLKPSDQRNNTIEFETFTGWDYRNPAVAHLAKGYWSGEKYRIGILFYDKRRNPFYVRWLNDYTFDDIDAKSGLLKNRGSGTDWFCLNPHLLKIDDLRIPKAVVDKIDGFSIVRAERDPVIITQGLCWQTQVEAGAPNIIHPLPLLTLNAQGHAADPVDHVYSYICPDDMVGHEPVTQRLMDVGDTMRVASWLAPLTYTGASYLYVQYGNAATGAQTIASKLYDYVAPTDTNYNNESTVSNFARVNEGDYISNFLSGNDYYNSDSWVGAPGAGTGTYNNMTGSAKVDANNFIFVGGKKIVVKTVADFDNYDRAGAAASPYSDTLNGNGDNPYKCLVNYIIPNTNQYGGTSEQALASTLYISTGHYQQIDADVIADNCDTGNVNSYSYLQFNNVWIGGGDCFTCMIDHGYGLFDSSYGPGTPFPATYGGAGYAVFFPCECNVNYNLRRGRKVSDYGMQEQTNGVTYSGGGGSGTLGPEDYSYNDGYSSDGDPFAYPALPVNYKNVGKFPYRIRFAGQKFPGELVDSFRVFLTDDYKDVDGQLGEINNLRTREGKTYYWQNNGVGYVPILERQTVSAGDGEATTLGTGGVVDRFDTLSAFYGNQHQWSLTDTKDGYIWFDMRNKDVVVMSAGGGIMEITSPLGLKSYFNEAFLEVMSIYYGGTLLNSPTFDASSDRPLMGTGIIGVYDPKLKVSYLTFKFKQWTQDEADPASILNYEGYQPISKDFTIAFSHVLNKFTGFHDKTPAIWHRHNQIVLSANNPKNLNVYYGSDMVVPTPVTIGDVIAAGPAEYVCTTSGTVAAYAATPSASLFTRINRVNEIYVENEEKTYTTVREGYLYNTLYGRVVNNEIEFVINPNTGWPFGVDNQLAIGNSVNYTDFTYSDGTNVSNDTNVKSYNRNYELTDGGWFFNVPLNRKGRLSGLYNIAKYVKRNWTTNPTTNVGSVKILQKVMSYFNGKF